MQGHIRSGVVMDVAAFKLCLSAGIVDIDATTLRAARARSSSNSEHTMGAMDAMPRKVQNACTLGKGQKASTPQSLC